MKLTPEIIALLEKSDAIYLIATQGENNFCHVNSEPLLPSVEVMEKITAAMMGSLKQFIQNKTGNGAIIAIVAAVALQMFPEIVAASMTTQTKASKN